MKKVLSLAVCILLVLAPLNGCGTTQKAAEQSTSQEAVKSQSSTADAAKPVTIKILQGQPEYAEAYNAYISEYKKVAPNVNIDIQVLHGEVPTVLKGRIASGDIPDIFSTTAGSELKEYAEYSADLSNEPLAKVMEDGVRKDMSYDGKLMAVPICMDVFAMMYNKALFSKAGITEMPKTLSELEDLCKKLQAKGITPFANGYKEWWVPKHIFNNWMIGETNDTEKLVNDFIAGKAKFKDHPTLLRYFDFIDLTVKYGLPKPLESDFNKQLSDFGTGKAAMVAGQGQWIELNVKKIDPNFQFGVMAYPVNDDPSKANVCAGAAGGLRVYKDSKVIGDAKNLLNWLYTSDYGKNWFAGVAKVVGPIKDIPVPDLQIVKGFQELTKEKPAPGLPQVYSTDSFHQKFGEAVQSYIAKIKTKDQAIDEIEKSWVRLGVAN